jgi:hypothetical protein
MVSVFASSDMSQQLVMSLEANTLTITPPVNSESCHSIWTHYPDSYVKKKLKILKRLSLITTDST